MGWGASLAGLDALDDMIEGVQSELQHVEYRIGTSVKYSIFVEYGTRSMQANRGMREAIETVVERAEQQGIAAQVSGTRELCEWIATEIESEWKAGIEGRRSGPRRVEFANYLNSVRAERVS